MEPIIQVAALILFLLFALVCEATLFLVGDALFDNPTNKKAWLCFGAFLIGFILFFSLSVYVASATP